MNRTWILMGLLILGSVALVGCSPSPPDCEVSDLVQPIPSGPLGDMIVTDLYAQLQWSYGAGYECQPDGFELELAHDSAFTSMYSYGATDAFDTSWGLPTPVPSGTEPPLPPASEFWWRVAGGLDDGGGGLDLGPWSVPVRFFTGPICAPGVGIPELVWPPDGATINTVLPLLDWEWPLLDCIPEGYRIDLYEDVEPASDILSGGTGNPSTSWFPGDDLLDCTAYRWFVSPMVDDMLGMASVEWGFYIDVHGTCAMPAGIGGMVWHDECGLPEHGPFPITPPPGCIDDGAGGYIANGVIDPGETGLGGVTLNLGAGPCPSTGLDTAVTNASGYYSFGSLTDGTYCTSVDSLADGNDAVIIPGGWSSPASTDSLVSHEITVAGGVAPEANFGWDWQFLPMPRTSGIVGAVWHDECAIPFDYAPGDPIPEGCIDVGGGVLGADGIFDDDEEGIPGVTLDLGHGACPSTGAYTAITDLDGVFMIPGLFDGTYCVTVNALTHGNELELIPGSWTFPDRDVNPQEVEFNILVPPEGVDVGLPLQNFGWDYQFLPMPEGEKSGNTNDDANCRGGPSMYYLAEFSLPEGTRLLIEGRDEDGRWLWVLPEGKQQRCWIWWELVELLFPIEELAPREAPLLVRGSISGWAYYDANGNHTRDGSDGAISGARLTLKAGTCQGSGSGTLAETDKSGFYSFTGLAPGDYCVLRDMLQQTLVPDYHDVTVHSGEDVSNVNFRRDPR